MGKLLYWDGKQDEAFHFKAVTVSFRDIEEKGDLFLEFVLRRPGSKPRSFRLPHGSFGARFRVGEIDRSRTGPQVLVSLFTGGLHCCEYLVLFTPHGREWRRTELGQYDVAQSPGDIRDLDGDGQVEFRLSDERFLYAFASYSGSSAPVRIIRVVDGAVVDVTSEPAFRPLVKESMTRSLEGCRDHQNSACAVLVAEATRLGRRDWAWKIMLKNHDRENDWGVGFVCDPARLSDCPAGLQKPFKSFPEALSAFLDHTGYR